MTITLIDQGGFPLEMIDSRFRAGPGAEEEVAIDPWAALCLLAFLAAANTGHCVFDLNEIDALVEHAREQVVAEITLFAAGDRLGMGA